MFRALQRLLPIAATLLAVTACSSASDRIRGADRTIEGEVRVDVDRLDAAQYSEEIRTLYTLSESRLIWSQSGRLTPRALEMIEILRRADLKGLNPLDYDGPQWIARLSELDRDASPSRSRLVDFDLALSLAVIRYVSDLHFGRVDPGLYRLEHTAESGREQLPYKVRDLAQADDLLLALERIEPPFDGYRRALLALRRYRSLLTQGVERLEPEIKVIEPGQHSTVTPSLVHLLRRLGDLATHAELPSQPELYSGSIVEALKHFQIRHGLEPDGRIGRVTLAELNTPIANRVRQLELTLERWRWVPHRFSRPPLVVNLPEFRLRAYNTLYRPELEMKIVAGRAHRHRTPVLAGELKYVVFRPYWNVPLSIQRAELVPKLRRDRSYLARNRYEVVTAGGAVVTRDLVDDDTLQQLRSGRLFLRQRPGPGNALGLVKFAFPNEHNIYLHDTPERELFNRSRRDFSHGCMRVERAADLAAWVLRDDPYWSAERVAAAMNGTDTIQINLKQPIPVLVVYGTAVVLESGDVRFFPDMYGYDAALETHLAGRTLRGLSLLRERLD